MPRSQPLAEREKQICNRLKEFRLSTKLSRVAFAELVGVDSSVVSRFEHARVAVRFDFVKRILGKFKLNIYWLAEGDGPLDYVWKTAEHLDWNLCENKLFSEVWDERFKKEIEPIWVRIKPSVERGVPWSINTPLGAPFAERSANNLAYDLQFHLAHLPKQHYKAYRKSILKASQKFLRGIGIEVEYSPFGED